MTAPPTIAKATLTSFVSQVSKILTRQQNTHSLKTSAGSGISEPLTRVKATVAESTINRDLGTEDLITKLLKGKRKKTVKQIRMLFV